MIIITVISCTIAVICIGIIVMQRVLFLRSLYALELMFKGTVSKQLAEQLLSVKTEGPKRIPFFSVADKIRLLEQWEKEGFVR